jgi:hypothetical protein
LTLLRFHHIGLIVDSIDSAIASYLMLHPNATCSPRYYITSQGVTVLFFHVDEHICYEFIEETDKPSAISTYIKKGIRFYHIGYKTAAFDEAISSLEEQGYKKFDLIISEAYQNKRVHFMLSPLGHWLEIIEE